MGLRFGKRLHFPMPALLLFLFGMLGACPTPAAAQTTQETALDAVTVATASDVVRNIGQSAHYVVYTTSGTITTLSIQLEGCFGSAATICAAAGTGWTRISETATNTVRGGVSANIYLPFVRVNLTAVTGGGSVTATYSGQSIGFAPPAGEFHTSGIFNKVLANELPADTTVTLDLDLPTGGTGGVLYFTYSAAGYAGATIQVDGGPDTAQLSAVLGATSLANVNTTQAFRVTSFAANLARVTYTTAGVTAVTFELSYAIGGGAAVAVDVVSFPANVPFDLNQVGGTAVVTGGVAGSQGVGGLVADGGVDAGNPVKIGGLSGGGNVENMEMRTSGDGDAIAFALVTETRNFLFNGTAPDRERNNEEITVLASVARTAAIDSSDLTNFNARGVQLFVDVTSITASPVLTVSVQAKDSISGSYKTIWTAPSTITATGETVYVLMPGVQAPGSGPGLIRSVLGTNPAAGSEFTETVPTGVRWKVHSLRVALTTDANAATRAVRLIVDDGSAILFMVPPGATQIASLARNYSAFHLGEVNTDLTADVNINIPPDLVLSEGMRILSSTTSIQVGDDFSAPRMLVEEWQVPTNAEASYFNISIPRTWRLSIEVDDADPMTYSVAASYN